jgi:hypothetical protein
MIFILILLYLAMYSHICWVPSTLKCVLVSFHLRICKSAYIIIISYGNTAYEITVHLQIILHFVGDMLSGSNGIE